MMKQSLLEQLRSQSTFVAMQWRTDIFDYFVCLIFISHLSVKFFHQIVHMGKVQTIFS